jgi:16S rRNA (cytidine1402-2'-O)-methyltransferase
MEEASTKTGTLYIVGTPIGNLGDITQRALDILRTVDVLLCEDTRVTSKLLQRYDIQKSLLSFHEHSDAKKLASVLERLESGQQVGLVTDAGTPGVSDPGNWLVAAARAKGYLVVPIPGVSALATLVSVAGVDMKEFIFKGFPPHKKGRQTFFTEVAAAHVPVVYFESPHRVVKNLELLETLAPEVKILVGRELTKMFEQIFDGNITEVKEYFVTHPEKVKGEFTIIVL